MSTVAVPAPDVASNRASSNTPPQLRDFDAVGDDPALVEALHAFGASTRLEECRELGRALGSAAGLEDGFAANEHLPVHRPYDRAGARTDDVTFDDGWHRHLGLAVEHGVGGAVWADQGAGAQVARAAKFIAVAQVEAGSTCPLAMTYACVPALRLTAAVAERWEGLVTSGVYDPAPLPATHPDKRGALIGMALTEKQGGSDVRANTTVAEPVAGEDGWYRVTGEKWFVSAVHSDAMFVLAQTAEGVSCLLVPRRRDDGGPNGWTIDRLKDKLGNRSNPTAEVRLHRSWGQLVGDPGRGVRAIMAMIGGTRQDCVLGSTAVMRTGTIEAIHWASHRHAFGRPLADQDAMTAVLADLALESEAATWSAMRLARATQDAADGDPQAIAFRRLAGPVLKFWVCKRAPLHSAEALECQGGYGYVEESRLPRTYREAPLMSIWEGSGNVQALDVLRALGREPESLEAFLAEVDLAAGADRRLDASTASLRSVVAAGDVGERDARDLTTRLARCLQASLLVRHAPTNVADAYCAARLTDVGGTLGCLPRGVDAAGLVARHRVPVDAGACGAGPSVDAGACGAGPSADAGACGAGPSADAGACGAGPSADAGACGAGPSA